MPSSIQSMPAYVLHREVPTSLSRGCSAAVWPYRTPGFHQPRSASHSWRRHSHWRRQYCGRMVVTSTQAEKVQLSQNIGENPCELLTTRSKSREAPLLAMLSSFSNHCSYLTRGRGSLPRPMFMFANIFLHADGRGCTTFNSGGSCSSEITRSATICATASIGIQETTWRKGNQKCKIAVVESDSRHRGQAERPGRRST